MTWNHRGYECLIGGVWYAMLAVPLRQPVLEYIPMNASYTVIIDPLSAGYICIGSTVNVILILRMHILRIIHALRSFNPYPADHDYCRF